MDLTQPDQLKDQLVHGSDFQKTMNAFFDIAEQPGFLDHGHRVNQPRLRTVVELVGSQLFKKPKLENLLPVKIEAYHFVHGGGTLNGRMMNFFYFEDIDCGLMAVMMDSTTAQFARITCKELPEGFELRN